MKILNKVWKQPQPPINKDVGTRGNCMNFRYYRGIELMFCTKIAVCQSSRNLQYTPPLSQSLPSIYKKKTDIKTDTSCSSCNSLYQKTSNKDHGFDSFFFLIFFLNDNIAKNVIPICKVFFNFPALNKIKLI